MLRPCWRRSGSRLFQATGITSALIACLALAGCGGKSPAAGVDGHASHVTPPAPHIFRASRPSTIAIANDCQAPDPTLDGLGAKLAAHPSGVAYHRLVNPPSLPSGQIPLGIQAHLRSLTGIQLGDVLVRMVGADLRFTREDFPWGSIEPRPGVFCWGRTDYWMYGAARAGVQVIAVADASPSWLESGPSVPPLDPTALQDYAEFVRELLGRYGSYGSFWTQHPQLRPDPIVYVDVWNEPYIRFFWRGDYPDPAGYATMFEAVVHTARPVDPQARFLLEADTTAQDGSPFLARVLEAQPQIAHDAYAVSAHPYASNGWGPDVCDTGGSLASRRFQVCRIVDLRHVLDAHGASGVKIFITELGWGVYGRVPPSLDPATIARYVRETFDALRTRWRGLISGLIWYQYQTAYPGPGRRGDFGLIQGNGIPYPAWGVLSNEAAEGISSG